MIQAPGFRLIIKPDEIEEKTESGIVIVVDKKLEKGATDRGTIVSIGPIAWQAFKPYSGDWAKVGDYIGYARYAGKWVTDTDGTEYLIIDDQDLVCVFNG